MQCLVIYEHNATYIYNFITGLKHTTLTDFVNHPKLYIILYSEVCTYILFLLILYYIILCYYIILYYIQNKFREPPQSLTRLSHQQFFIVSSHTALRPMRVCPYEHHIFSHLPIKIPYVNQILY